MRLLHLAVRVLEQHRVAAVQHARAAEGERRRIVAEPGAAAARLDAEQAHAGVPQERMEQADRVRSAADAGDRDVRQAARLRDHLRARLAPDHRLQLAHQVRIGMRPDRGAEQVVAAGRIRDPVAHRLVDRGAQRPVAALDRHDLGAEQAHAPDVRRLALHVHAAHVDDAGQAEPRAGRRGRDPVLAGAGLRDDALRAEALCEQRLAERIVDLVRAGMREVLALEPDVRVPGARQPGARA